MFMWKKYWLAFVVVVVLWWQLNQAELLQCALMSTRGLGSVKEQNSTKWIWRLALLRALWGAVQNWRLLQKEEWGKRAINNNNDKSIFTIGHLWGEENGKGFYHEACLLFMWEVGKNHSDRSSCSCLPENSGLAD